MAHMSISALIAADPISASRYVDNKFNVMLEFLTSTDVLGEITHYFRISRTWNVTFSSANMGERCSHNWLK